MYVYRCYRGRASVRVSAAGGPPLSGLARLPPVGGHRRPFPGNHQPLRAGSSQQEARHSGSILYQIVFRIYVCMYVYMLMYVYFNKCDVCKTLILCMYVCMYAYEHVLYL